MLSQTALKIHLPLISLTLQKLRILVNLVLIVVCFLDTISSQEKIYCLSSQHDLWVIEFYGLWHGVYHQLQSNYVIIDC